MSDENQKSRSEQVGKSLSKKGAQAAGKAAKKGFEALPPQGKIVVLIIAGIFLFTAIVGIFADQIVINTNTNNITHVSHNVDKDKGKIEDNYDEKTVKKNEAKYANAVLTGLDGSKEEILEEIQQKCDENGVNYEESAGNIIDNVGLDELDGSGSDVDIGSADVSEEEDESAADSQSKEDKKKINKIVSIAKKWNGVPYSEASADKKGISSPAFVAMCYEKGAGTEFGDGLSYKDLNNINTFRENTGGIVVKDKNIKKGDIVFFKKKKKNYVGISLGSQIIYSGADKSSSTKKTGVRTENKDGKKITRVVRVYYTAQDNADSGKFKKKLSKVKPLNKYEKTVYSYLRNQGYSEYAAAGIMGNWIAESSYNPASVNSYGYSGIAQWGGGRLRKLKNLAQSKGKNWTNLLIQLQFFTKETKETGSYKEFQSKKFKETKNILYATDAFCRRYEIPGNFETEVSNRYRLAKQVYARYTGCDPGSISGGGIGTSTGINYNFSKRQMNTILAAFSVKESQLLGTIQEEKTDNDNAKELREAEKKKAEAIKEKQRLQKKFSKSKKNGILGRIYQSTIGKLNEKISKARIGEKLAKLMKVVKKKIVYREWSSKTKPVVYLNKITKRHKKDFFHVKYGKIVTNSNGEKVYSNIEINHASRDEIIKNVFNMNPKGVYCMRTINEDYGDIDDFGFTASDGDFLNPFKGGHYRMDTEWSQPRNDHAYGTENGIRWHDGCDLGATYGTNLYAACNGKVNMVRSGFGGYGGYLEYYAGRYKAPNGKKMKTWIAYGHISKSFVREGQVIKKGQLIAQVGEAPTGHYPHLHLEFWLGRPGPASYGHCHYSVDAAFYIKGLYKVGTGGHYASGLATRGWGNKPYRPGAPWLKM